MTPPRGENTRSAFQEIVPLLDGSLSFDIKDVLHKQPISYLVNASYVKLINGRYYLTREGRKYGAKSGFMPNQKTRRKHIPDSSSDAT